jgi:carbonic anhydrase
MDTRIDVLAQLGLKEGDAHIIRNAGGVAYVRVALAYILANYQFFSCYRQDTLRSIIISQRLAGTREIALFHHTGCGLLTVRTAELRERIKSSEASTTEIDHIDFLEFDNVEGAVRTDVQWLRANKLIFPETVITGWVYEVETGKVSMLSRGTALKY